MQRPLILAAGLILALVTVGYAQDSRSDQERSMPHFRVQIWGDTFVDFNTRVSAYDALRTELEKGLPELTTTDDVGKIRKAVRARAKRIRAARSDAREGDIFTPAISDSFKRALEQDLDGGTCAAILDDNPGEFHHHINGRYPDKRPLSTVPPSVLAALPELPDDLQYRFLGRTLVLLDGRSGVIIDRIRLAIPCQV